jgi:hypothetical protein
LSIYNTEYLGETDQLKIEEFPSHQGTEATCFLASQTYAMAGYVSLGKERRIKIIRN